MRWSPIDFIKSPAVRACPWRMRCASPHAGGSGLRPCDLSVGWHETSEPLTTKAIEDGHWTFVSQQIKTVAKKPVAQGIATPIRRVMEQNLQDGKMDVVAGLRYSIADRRCPQGDGRPHLRHAPVHRVLPLSGRRGEPGQAAQLLRRQPAFGRGARP
ncbi:MAG: hypothetical protein ACLSVD_00135 [Eggerthellaceae bacterium]